MMVKRNQVHTIACLFVFVAAWGTAAAAAGPPATPVGSRIAETQVTLQVGPRRARATVIAKGRDALAVETAAHVVSAEDLGRPVVVGRGGRRLGGRVAEVVRNPGFHPSRRPSPDDPSIEGAVAVDSAVAIIELPLRDEAERREFEAIRTADLAARPVLGRGSGIVSVHIVDQDGREHVVRAGNHLNPKCLAWGRAGYDPRPGDSGSGVFVVAGAPGGEARPILVGNVAQADDRGGIATLAHRHAPWIEGAIERWQSRSRLGRRDGVDGAGAH